MQKIIPHIWYDKEAKEAAAFYVKVFPDAKMTNLTVIHDTPSGESDLVSFELMGQPFMAISAGPYFKVNPSISFMVNFDPSKMKDAKEELDRIWHALIEGGIALMPLQEYPFSKWYGWVQDKYGVSWQLILTNPEGEERPAILPSLLFTNDVYGKVEEALHFYVSVFKDAQIGRVARYGAGQAPDTEGKIMFSDFRLLDTWFVAMESAHKHAFAFNEAISFIVECETQAEIDYYWEKLSAVPEAEQCGWLKDKFGVSWQITPTMMNTVYKEGSEEQIKRVTEAFLKMKKFDIATLLKAYRG